MPQSTIGLEPAAAANAEAVVVSFGGLISSVIFNLGLSCRLIEPRHS
jgi:hypothetical protein